MAQLVAHSLWERGVVSSSLATPTIFGKELETIKVVGWRKFSHFDYWNFFIVEAIALLGLLFIFSSTYSFGSSASIFFYKQLFGIISGTGIYFFILQIEPTELKRLGYYLFFAVIGLLIFTLVKGSIGLGAKRWINLGIIKFQPSELMKLFMPPFIINYLQHHYRAPSFKLTDFAPLVAFLLFGSLLVLKQPDLGTAITLMLSGLTLLWLAGVRKKIFAYAFVFFVAASPIAIRFLKPYQLKRIEVFLGSGSKTKELLAREYAKEHKIV